VWGRLQVLGRERKRGTVLGGWNMIGKSWIRFAENAPGKQIGIGIVSK
jgi:hypothetical protein